MTIEMSARRNAVHRSADRVSQHTECIDSNDRLLYREPAQGACGPSLMIAVNAGFFGIVTAAAFALVEIVAHLVS